MEVTYQTLKVEGHILDTGDILTIHGCKYRVHENKFLVGLNCCNDTIFEVLGIDKEKVCREFGMKAIGDFTYMESFIALTRLVIDLYERSPYKVGDKVRIKRRERKGDEYPFTFVDDMADLEGKVYTIKSISIVSFFRETELCNGDPHKYRLVEDSCQFSWHSSMFEPAEYAEEKIPMTKEESYEEEHQPNPEMYMSYKQRHTKTKTHIIL